MSLVKTYLLDLRADVPANNDRDELRTTQDGLLTLVINATNSVDSVVSPDLRAKAEESEGRNLDIPVMKKGIVTISNVRSCEIGGTASDSDLVRVVWKTAVADLVMVPASYHKNLISYRYDLAKKIREIVEAFKVAVEQDIDTALDANKTQVYGSSIVGTTYTLSGGAIQVPTAKQDFFFNDINAINFADDFNATTTRIVASHSVMPVVTKYINQGAGNSANTSFQYLGKNFTFSNRITNDAGKTGTGYFMPDGSIGLLTRVDITARLGLTAGDGTEWMEETLPDLPFPVGIQYKSKCDDQSLLEPAGLAHLTATMVEHWQISFDYAIVVPYNSAPLTRASAIRKFEFVP